MYRRALYIEHTAEFSIEEPLHLNWMREEYTIRLAVELFSDTEQL